MYRYGRFGDEADGDMIGLMNICDILRFFPPFSGAHKRFGERDQTVLGKSFCCISIYFKFGDGNWRQAEA